MGLESTKVAVDVRMCCVPRAQNGRYGASGVMGEKGWAMLLRGRGRGRVWCIEG